MARNYLLSPTTGTPGTRKLMGRLIAGRRPAWLLGILGVFALALAAALLGLLPANPALAQDDTARPAITAGPVITSSPASGDTYAGGEVIKFAVTFSEPVTVTGEPRLRFRIGSKKRWAEYSSNPEGNKPIFAYTVTDKDKDEDGISINKNQVKLNGGTIKDDNDNDAQLKHGKLAAQAGHKVDGVKPKLTGIKITSTPSKENTYTEGEIVKFRLNFSEPVVTNDRKSFLLNLCVGCVEAEEHGNTWAGRARVSGNGKALLFTWKTPRGFYDADGISFPKYLLDLNVGGSIKDKVGNEAILTYSGGKSHGGHKVDAGTPIWETIEASAGDGQVTLSWAQIWDYFNGGPDTSITKFQYRQKAGDSDYGEWTNIPGSNYETTEYIVGSLANGTEYTFQVRAMDTVNTGESSEVTATPATN